MVCLGSGKLKTGCNVLIFQIREVLQDLGPGYAGGEKLQNILDTNSQAPNTGSSAADFRINGEAVHISIFGKARVSLFSSNPQLSQRLFAIVMVRKLRDFESMLQLDGKNAKLVAFHSSRNELRGFFRETQSPKAI